MKSILILSQKGGCGKSTLADETAFALERAGTPFAFYSLDEQGDALHEPGGADDAAVAVVDTPGALTDDTPDLIRDADVVVIPTRASGRDMTALNRTRDLVATAAPSVPVLIIVNGWNRWSNARQFREWLDGTLRPTERVEVLSQSDMIPKSEAAGESVVTFAPRSKSAKEMAAVTGTILGLVGLEVTE